MSGLAILVAAAALGFALSHWLKLPVIPLLIVPGFLLSHAGLGLEPGSGFLNELMGLGLAFLVFVAGIELNPRRFRGKTRVVLWIAGAQFLALAVGGFALALVLGFGTLPAIHLGAALATSSTFVVVRQLNQRVGSLRAYGRLAIGALLVQDLVIIIVIVVLGAVPDGGGALLEALGEVALIGTLSFTAQRWFFPLLVRRRQLDDEILLLVLLATLFLFAGVADVLGLPFVVGAFFAGFALSSFPINGVARSLLGSLASFFLAIFFTALGAFVVLPDPLLTLKALAFVALVLVVTPPLVALLAEWRGGLSSRNAIKCGLLLAQTSEFSLVLGLFAVSLGGLSREVMSVIAIVAVVTMTITPLIASEHFARRLLRFHPLHRRLATETNLHDHVLMLGFGAEGRWAIRPLREAGHHVVVVDHDPAVIETLERAGIPCIRGDSADEKTLRHAGLRHARLVLVGIPNIHEALRILRAERPADLPVLVRVFEEEHAHQIEDAGAIPILNSHAAAESFMEWFGTVEWDGGRTPNA